MKVALSGSGMLYPVHVGAIKRLMESGNIREISGTSGGAIVAAMVASDVGRLEEMVINNMPMDGKLFNPSLTNLRNYGLMDGRRIERLFERFFPATFSETKIPLRVVTANLNKRTHMVFGTEETPSISVARAVRASMSIPGIFSPVSIGGDLHVDGGIAANLPINLYSPDDDVIGIRVRANPKMNDNISGVKDYIMSVMSIVMDTLTNHGVDHYTNSRIITIYSNNNGLNFMMSKEDAIKMMWEGYKTVDKWIKKNNLSSTK